MNKIFYEIDRISNLFSPKKIILGKDSVKTIGDEVKKLGGSRALVVTDPGLVSVGLVKLAEDSLHDKQIEVAVFDKVRPEPPAHIVDECAEIIRQGGYDVVIGIGGGSSLDIAKGSAIMATNHGAIWTTLELKWFKNLEFPEFSSRLQQDPGVK